MSEKELKIWAYKQLRAIRDRNLIYGGNDNSIVKKFLKTYKQVDEQSPNESLKDKTRLALYRIIKKRAISEDELLHFLDIENIDEVARIVSKKEICDDHDVSNIWDYYEKVETIGSGQYGKVYMVEDRKTGTLYAMKKVNTFFFGRDNFNTIKTELKALQILTQNCSENIATLHDWKCSKEKIYIITEYIDGIILKNFLPKDEKEVQKVFLGLAKGLKCLHDNDVVHMDLHGENIMINQEDSTPKIIDFGLSCFSSLSCMLLKKIIGSEQWQEFRGVRAPEIVEGTIRPNIESFKKADLWMLGRDFDLVISNIPKLLPIYRRLILSLKAYDPDDRPSIDEVIYDLKNITQKEIRDDIRNKLKRIFDTLSTNPYRRKIIIGGDKAKIEKKARKILTGLRKKYSHIDLEELENVAIFKALEKITVYKHILDEDFFNVFDVMVGLGMTPRDDFCRGRNRTTVTGHFEYLKNIGQGMNARVDLYYDNLSRKKVAIKIIDMKKISMNGYRVIKLELDALDRLNHPCAKYISKIYDYFCFRNEIWIVMEYIKGTDLDKFIPKSPEQIEDIMVGILKGVKCLHDHDVVHMDLHASNIIIDRSNKPRIIDFGQSCITLLSCEMNEQYFSWQNHPENLPPELPSLSVEKNIQAYKKLDIWRLGKLFYELLKIREPSLLTYYKGILRRSMSKDPHARPTIDQLLHIFEMLREYKEDIRRLSIKKSVKPWIIGECISKVSENSKVSFEEVLSICSE